MASTPNKKAPLPGAGGTAAPGSQQAGPARRGGTPSPGSQKTAVKPKPDPYGGLTGDDRDAAAYLTHLFTTYGLGTLAPKIISFLKQGFSADTIQTLLVETPEYERRFAANADRRKAGLPVLSPAEYLSTESSYRSIMSAAGLPAGFYDQTSDFTKWIAGDVSPTEIQSRVQVASDLIENADPATKAYFKSHYTKGDLVAYALDRKRAVPLIENQFKAAQVGGAAQAQGLNVSTADAMNLAKNGVTQSQAQQGFGFVKENLAQTQLLGSVYGEQTGQKDLVAEVFNNDAAATARRKRLASKERAAFGGSGGLSQTSLSSGSAGSI